MDWKKYQWYILGYILYVSIVLASIWDEGRDFWPMFIIWCISIPLALYIIWSLVWKYIKSPKPNINKNIAVENNSVKSYESNPEKESSSSDVVKTWSLVEFAKEHGKMQVGDFTNRITGEKSKSCIFTDKNGNTVNVSFDSKLGTLTPLQIKEKRDSLKVCLLKTNKYMLFKELVGWNEVNLES